MTFARKINKIPEFYTIFARKMPEFYIIIARKIFFPNFGGTCPSAPISYAYAQNHRIQRPKKLLFTETWPKNWVGRSDLFFSPTMVLTYANIHTVFSFVAFYFHFASTCSVILVER